MAPQDETFTSGDTVRLKDQPEVVGILLKPVGKDRWAVKAHGDEKSRVVRTDNLQKPTDTQPEKYSIVGTWDDWEPHDMTWNPEAQAYEYKVVLGENGHEGFKVLLNGDWDKCVYPSVKHASPYDGHTLGGPDDGGFDEEWTIGKHERDKGSHGTAYKVRMYTFPSGGPKQVTWDYFDGDGGGHADAAPAQRARPPRASRLPWNTPSENEPPNRSPNANERVTEDLNGFGTWLGELERQTQQKEKDLERQTQQKEKEAAAEARYKPRQTSTRPWDRDEEASAKEGVYEHMLQKQMEKEIVDQERAARERLVKRLEAAAEAEPLMIEDGVSLGQIEVEERKQRVEENMKRYKNSLDEQMSPGMLRPATTSNSSCVECGKYTSKMLRGTRCCEVCKQEWDEIVANGWEANVVCAGVPAGMRAMQIATDSGISNGKARRQVLSQYSSNFKRHGGHS